jgi:hypothetical protein
VSDPRPQAPGCSACRTPPATQSDLRLERVRNLYESPHEGYAVFRCPACGTPFLEQFQEVTWLPSGEDDIWLRWMPLTPDELAEVEALFPAQTEDGANAHHLARLMHRRGRLVRDPLGRFAWSEDARDVGNLYPPG